MINPYDPCVANKIINGNQCTIAWHIADIKISHKAAKVVDQIVNQLKSMFGNLGDLTISRGKQHDYLGMFLDFSNPGKLLVDMRPYIKTISIDLPKEMQGKAQTPASIHQFNMDANGRNLLDNKKAEHFHSMTMQLMYLSQQG